MYKTSKKGKFFTFISYPSFDLKLKCLLVYNKNLSICFDVLIPPEGTLFVAVNISGRDFSVNLHHHSRLSSMTALQISREAQQYCVVPVLFCISLEYIHAEQCRH